MAQITAALVKELREKTSAGMMDCKKALNETNGDLAAAADWLRTKGIAKADKKASRVAAEGLVAIALDGTTGAVVEVNSETDFVARNDGFQAAVAEVAQLALTVNSDEELAAAKTASGDSVTEHFKKLVGKIGENMAFRRMAKLSVTDGVVAGYIHNAVTEGMGKIGVLVALSGDNEAFGKQVAMHVAAVNPASMSEADLDPAVVEKEKQVQIDIARESGKPDAVIEKMIVGRMKKFVAEATLLNQAFVINPDLTVEAAAKEAGATITGFVRLEVGEGIEVVKEDFAAEVAKINNG